MGGSPHVALRKISEPALRNKEKRLSTIEQISNLNVFLTSISEHAKIEPRPSISVKPEELVLKEEIIEDTNSPDMQKLSINVPSSAEVSPSISPLPNSVAGSPYVSSVSPPLDDIS